MHIRVFLLALVGVLLVCLPLSAVEEAPFSIGIFALQEDSTSLKSQVEEAGATYANLFLVPSTDYAAFLEEKRQRQRQLITAEEISRAYASKSEKDLEKASEVDGEQGVSIPSRLAVTYRQIPYHEGFSTLLTRYPGARYWYASQQGLDALILIKRTKLASNDRIRLYWHDTFSDTTTVILDQVVMVQNSPSEMLEKIGAALLAKTAGPEYGLLVLDNVSSSTQVAINGEPLLLKGRQELFASGEYSLSLSAEGFLARQLSVSLQPNTIVSVDASLDRMELGDMHLTSTTGKVNWFVDGLLYDTACELSISSSLVPLVVVAQKEGFASKTLQVQKPESELSVSLQPQWMTRSALVQEEQRLFYKSFRNTMLVFGLYVASSTLSRTFDVGNPLWQPLQVATSGFALVSTLHTILNFASYASLAGSGVY